MAKTIADILAAKQLIDLALVAEIKKEAKEKKLTLEEVLYARGTSERDIAEAKSELTGFPPKLLEGVEIPSELLREIPEESARHYFIIPLAKTDGFLEVGMLHPEDIAAREALKFISARSGLPVKIFIITPSDFNTILKQYENISGEVTKAYGEFQKEYGSIGEEVKIKKEERARIVDDAPVTKMMAVILRHAVEGRASDIHIEPERDKLRVRFRVDGTLHTSLTLPSDIHPAMISRVKVMTNLKIDETRVPQDGRFRAEVLGRDIDFRVSTFPTAYGEKIAIRILDSSTGVKSLEDLGFAGRNLSVVQESIQRPFGMVLVTGPTGSGKSTTLYAMLQILNQEETNIVSLEDPVEYYIDGVNQSQVRPEINYDFSSGLRSILRQDPDIIMVGEIRDKETAGLAVHAALTGHLVLSTLHTNTATGVIPRLIDMGVDPYLIPPTLILAVGQRLVRKLCPDSRNEIPVEKHIKEVLQREIETLPEPLKSETKQSQPSVIYQALASSTCPKGTKGRMGVFEVLAMTPDLEQIILSGPSEAKIQQEAKRQGMISMRQDGMLKVLKGTVGLEELLEVV